MNVTITPEWLIALGGLLSGVLAWAATNARRRDEKVRERQATELARIVAENAAVAAGRTAAIEDAARYRLERDEALEDRDQERERSDKAEAAWQQRYAWQSTRCEERVAALSATLQIATASLLDETIKASAEDVIDIARQHIAADHPDIHGEAADLE